MTFDEFWQALAKRNPRLANEQETVTCHVSNYREALRQAFEMGEKYEREMARLAEHLLGRAQR